MNQSESAIWHLNRTLTMDKVGKVKHMLLEGFTVQVTAFESGCAERDIQSMADYLTETRSEVSA